MPRLTLIPIVALVGACAGAPARPESPPAAFSYHVGFWLSLHLRLYGESGPRGAREPLEDETWNEALAAYRTMYTDRDPRDLLVNKNLVALARRLAETPDDAIPPDPVLARAAPVYRQHRWPDDRARAAAWIANMEKLVAAHGAALTRDLAAAYRTPWPATPIRVEVVPYATFAGAYTVLDPPLITVSGRDDRNQGDDGLEILFHEASHALVESISAAIGSRCPQAPHQLWHAMLFYTTGQLVKRQLGASYVPYAWKNGLWERLPGLEAMEAGWQPYLDGKRSFEDGIAAVCAALPR